MAVPEKLPGTVTIWLNGAAVASELYAPRKGCQSRRVICISSFAYVSTRRRRSGAAAARSRLDIVRDAQNWRRDGLRSFTWMCARPKDMDGPKSHRTAMTLYRS